MINTYLKKPEVVRAIQLEDTADSPTECVLFILGAGIPGGKFNRHSWGVRIVYPNGVLCADFGDYIVRTSLGNFLVFSKAEFESEYTKVVVGDPPYTVPEKTVKWDGVGERKYT